ncbi:MAG: phage Gp37/Gp68 family protein [bacterium]|nr:phage Gp37/Gp68 family protein [bacterium]
MAESAIEWTDATWNPTTGCDRISPGCDNCYALKMAGRLKLMGQAKYQADGDPQTSGPGFALTCHSETLSLPATWAKPRMVFVNSMSDLFHEDVPVGFIQDVLEVMRNTPGHTYQVLTKRSRRLAQLSDVLEWPSNAWVGVSVESARYLFRLRHLQEVPVTVRFVSAEPLLGPLGTLDLTGIGWLIAGGESGVGARPMSPEWVSSLRDRCVEAGVPFFFKQWGGRYPKVGGRDLDGRTWNEYPM